MLSLNNEAGHFLLINNSVFRKTAKNRGHRLVFSILYGDKWYFSEKSSKKTALREKIQSVVTLDDLFEKF